MILCSKPYECKHYPTGVMCVICENGNRFKPRAMTNADRIRSMTDEELAEFICYQIIDRNIGIPLETWFEWLKQEVTEHSTT